MRRIVQSRWIAIAGAALAAIAGTATPAWAFAQLPGPEAGGIAGAAIIGAIIVAKMWRRR